MPASLLPGQMPSGVRGFNEGPKAAILQPALEPLLAELDQLGVGIQ